MLLFNLLGRKIKSSKDVRTALMITEQLLKKIVNRCMLFKSKNIGRISALVLLPLVMVLLSIYGQRNDPSITLSMCLQAPQRYDLQTITIGIETTIKKIEHDNFVVTQMGRDFLVYGHCAGMRENDFVQLVGIFHKEGWLELESCYVARYRRIKIWISIFPIFLVAGLFFKEWRWHWKSMSWGSR